MAANVSIMTASPERAQSSPAPATSSAPTAGRFASALDAAQPRDRAPPSAQRSGPTQGATDKTSGAVNQATDATQASDGAATAVDADASSIDSNAVDQGGKATGKSSGKSRTGDPAIAAASITDPSALAFLLAAAGLQVDGGNGSGAQAGNEPRTNAAGGGAADQTAVAGAIAVSATMTAAMAGPLSAVQAIAATLALSTDAIGSTTSGAKPGVPADTASPIKFESITVGDTPIDASNAALLLQQSSSADSKPSSDQSSSQNASSGLPDMIRALSSTTQSAAVERTVALPMTDRNWPGAVAGHVQWLINNNVQSATLQLSPDHLGPVEIRIDVQQSQVNVSFTAAHPDTRSALEQSVPRLREIFAGGGLTLGQATVQQESRSGSHFSSPAAHAALRESQNVEPVSISATRALGLLDEYA